MKKQPTIELVKITSIKENPGNPRTISKEKFEKLKKSIQEFPEMLRLRPIVVNERNVALGGNMRLKALHALKYKEIPIIRIRNLTKEQQKRFIITDNISYGDWEWEELANSWNVLELQAWGLDLPNFLDKGVAVEDDYEMPEDIETDIVKGDLFEIGPHRLLCGDSTKAEDVEKLMGGGMADMVFTDPPYNVDYGANPNPRHKIRTIKNDKMNTEDWNQFVINYMNSIFKMCEGNIYISMSDKELGHMQSTFRDCGGKWASFIIWVKDRLVLSPKDYHSRHETILFGWKEGCKNRLRVMDRKQDDVWEIKRPGNSEEHPTMKPIELMSRAINNSSKVGQIVGDLFLGSGSTMIASHQLKRNCFGMELDPKYCAVIIDRMLKLDTSIEVKKNGKPYNKS